MVVLNITIGSNWTKLEGEVADENMGVGPTGVDGMRSNPGDNLQQNSMTMFF